MSAGAARAPGAPVNPFSARYHQPGAVAFLFEAGRGADSAADLYQAFRAAGWRGTIVGPHGTGKTTLLRALEAPFRAHGHAVYELTLREDAPRLPRGWWRKFPAAPGSPPPCLFLDGAEQLSWPAWLALRLWRRHTGAGVLATVHRPLGWPVLYRTGVSENLALRVAERVLAATPDAPRRVQASEVTAALARTRGDLREAFFQLYDLYEVRSQPPFPVLGVQLRKPVEERPVHSLE